MTVRHAKLYTIEANDIVVAKEAYEVYNCSLERPFPLNDEEWASFYDPKVEHQLWPVDTITINGKEEHIVLDPNLREYLSLPFRTEVEETKERLRWARQESESNYRLLCRLEGKVFGFIRAPWYVRLWRALRNDLL